MSERRKYEIELFSIKKSIRAPFESEKEVKEFCHYLEQLIELSTKGKGSQALANRILQDNSLLRIILNMGYELYKLKNKINYIEAELELRLDEALQILDKIKKGED